MARNLRLFYLFRLLATSYLFLPVVVLFQAGRGLSLQQILVLNGIYCAAAIASEIPTGALADRIGRRRSMMLGALALVAACLAYARAHSFTLFAVGTATEALSLTLTSGADSAYLYDLLLGAGRSADYPGCEGTATAAHYFGNALVCALGGVLASRALVLPYLVTAGIGVATFFVAAAMREEPPPAARARRDARWQGYRQHIRASLSTVLRRERLLWAVAYSALLFVLVRSSDYLFQIYLEPPYVGLPVLKTSLVLAGLFVVAACAAQSLPALRARLGDRALVFGTPAVLVAGYVLLARYVGGLGLVVLCAQSVASGVFSPFTKMLVNGAITDSSRRATILSVESMVRRLAYGLFSAGVLATLIGRHGLGTAMLACAALGVLGTAALAVLAGRRGAAALPAELSPPAAQAEAPVAGPLAGAVMAPAAAFETASELRAGGGGRVAPPSPVAMRRSLP